MTIETLRRYNAALEHAVNTNEFVGNELKTHGRNDRESLFRIAELYEMSARVLEMVAPPEGQEDFHAEVIASDRELAALARQRGLFLTTWPAEILEKSDLFDALDKRAQRVRERLAVHQRS